MVTEKMTPGNTVRLYYGGPLWEVLWSRPAGVGSAYVLCVRKHGRREMAIYRVCDLVLINQGIGSRSGQNGVVRQEGDSTERCRPDQAPGRECQASFPVADC